MMKKIVDICETHLSGSCTPNQNLQQFVHYPKSTYTVLKNN